ncbi:MAG: hypothetical protein AAGC43_17480 [Bacteroidota bacterium]
MAKVIHKGRNSSLSKHYLRFAVFGIAITIIGFIPTYFRPLVEAKSFDPIYHIHGFFSASWLILFLVQSALINRANHKLHRKLGWLGIVVSIGIVITLQRVGFVTATREIETGIGLGAQTFLGTVLDSLTMGTLIIIAIVLRRKADIHKRLMLLATIIMLWVAWMRLRYYFPPFPGNFDLFGFVFAMLPIPIFWWIERGALGKIHPTMLKVGLMVILEQGIQVAAPYLGYSEEITKVSIYLYALFGGQIS